MFGKGAGRGGLEEDVVVSAAAILAVVVRVRFGSSCEVERVGVEWKDWNLYVC